jgi:hypothetical protein
MLDALRKLLSPEIPSGLWDGNSLMILVLAVAALGVLLWKAFSSEIAKRFAQYVSDDRTFKFLFVYAFPLVVCLAAGYWRTAVVITICSLVTWVLRRRPEIRKAGWRLIVPQIAVFILAMIGENFYIDYLRATRNQKQQVYVVLSKAWQKRTIN